MKIIKLNDESIIPKLFKHYEEIVDRYNNKKIEIYYIEDNNNYFGRIIVDYDNRYLDTETIKNVRVCLSYLFIYPEYRRNGYASKLIDYVLNDLLEQGYTEYTVGVEPENIPALELYKRKGFTSLIDHSDKPFPFDLYLYKR